MKLVKKWRVGSRWVGRYDRPQTAYQRLLASDQLSLKGQSDCASAMNGSIQVSETD